MNEKCNEDIKTTKTGNSNPFNAFVKSELTGWKPLDIAWLLLATAVILGLSIYWKDTWLSLLAAVTGV